MKESAISQFTYLPESKEERETFVQMCVDEVKSGERNPLQLEVILKNLEETINAIRKHPEVKDLIYEEASKYPEKTFKAFGCTITKTNRTSYSYSNCNDSVYNDMKQEESELKERIKEREGFLKSLKPGMSVADAVTGEMIQAPQISTTESLTIKLG